MDCEVEHCLPLAGLHGQNGTHLHTASLLRGLHHPGRMNGLLLETCWRMRGRSERVFTCGIYCVENGLLEVRVSRYYGATASIVFSTTLTEIEAARKLAEQWRETMLSNGRFHELLH